MRVQPYEEVGFLQVAALRALAVQLLDRRRSGAIITALGQGGQSSQLSRLVYRAVTGITSPAASQDQSRWVRPGSRVQPGDGVWRQPRQREGPEVVGGAGAGAQGLHLVRLVHRAGPLACPLKARGGGGPR